MKKSNIFLILVTTLALAGCNEVPEDVRSRTEERNARMSIAQQNEPEAIDLTRRVTLEEAKKELENYRFGVHDNLRFVCTVPKTDAEKLYNIFMPSGLQNIPDEADIERAKFLVEKIWNKDPAALTYQFMGSEVMVSSPETGITAEIPHENSSFVFYDFSVYVRSSDKLTYRFYMPEEQPKEARKMADGSTLTIDDAIKQADGYLEKMRELGVFDSSEYQRFYRAGIANAEDKGDIIILRYQQVRYGIPFDDSGFKGIWSTRTPYVEIWFAGDNAPCILGNWQSGFETKKEEIGEIIPFSSAEYIVSEKLAPGMVFDVTDAELRYLCLTWEKTSEMTEDLKFQLFWCFNLKENKGKGYCENTFERTELYVDAVTGELYYSNPAEQRFLTEEQLKEMY